MSNVFDPQIMKMESDFFTAETSSYYNVNNVKYSIKKSDLENLKLKFFGTKSTLFRQSSYHNEAYALEQQMRNCFKKCNKFVLEDWIDYDELDCTLKCSISQKEAYKILKEKSF